jgi:hypothetical protein
MRETDENRDTERSGLLARECARPSHFPACIAVQDRTKKEIALGFPWDREEEKTLTCGGKTTPGYCIKNNSQILH